MQKIMITGAAGFIGGFLAKYCSEAGCCVLGQGVTEPTAGWVGVGFERCDIRDSVRLSELISSFRPDRVFHLAAQSYPTVSLDRPRETMDINAGGTINLFECLRAANIMPVVMVACSSAEYGLVAAADLPVREDHPLRPLHPYGISKVAQDLLAAQYCLTYGIPTVRIRIFNTTGPGKIDDVCSDLTKRAIEIELGLHRPSLRVGNLTSRRAIIDVRDMVRALHLAAERCQHGEVYNVGATQTYSVKELIQAIRACVKVPFRIEQDRALMRVCDEPVIAGDIRKFQHSTGWSPKIDLTNTLEDMLIWWRQRLSGCPLDPDHCKQVPASSSATGVDSAMGRE
jgi:GDP-4-dehydro-6-deoxy-D-mannose reductase